MPDESSKYWEAFSRNIGILSKDEQHILADSCVAVAGAGGVGGHQAITLARAGIGEFKIADPEVFSQSDRNRQYGAAESTTGMNKAEITVNILKDINPEVKVTIFKLGVSKKNIAEFIQDADVVIDAIEYFALDQKIALHSEARRQKKYVFTSPILGFASSLLVFAPDGMSFTDYFTINENNEKLELGLFLPEFPEYIDSNVYKSAIEKRERPIPSFSTAATLSGAILANEIVLFLTHKREPVTVPRLIHVDMFKMDYRIVDMSWKLFWSQFASESYDYISLLSENKDMLQKIAAIIGINKFILDAGCGTGNLIKILEKDNKVEGIDFSPGMVKKAISKCKNFSNVHIVQGDVCGLPYDNEQFDIVTSINVFFNLENPELALKEANRVLKINGRLIISTPINTGNPLQDVKENMISDFQENNIPLEYSEKIWKYQMKLKKNGGFKNMPTLEHICSLLELHGFEIEESQKVYFSTNALITARKK